MVDKIAVYFRETRPQFLLLTPVCLLVGASAAFWQAGTINAVYLAIAFLGALAAHVAVNVLNDYFDFQSGLDLHTIPTPFSGGSGILPAKQMSPPAALRFGLASLAATIMVGIYFFLVRGGGILLVGLPGLLLVVLYTQHITRFPLLCLLAPGLGFGPCMVLGTYYVLQGFYDWTAVAASLIPGFLVSNLLLLNQFPDLEADRRAGRRHLPIALGKTRSARVYSLLALTTYLWLILATSGGFLPYPTLLALLPLPLVFKTIRGVQKHAEERASLIPLLGQNVLFTLATPFLLAVGFLLS